ncbi:MAG TPA: hypothetical protein VHZ54_16815 [Solirubrobacterales bacterium]|jgi:hypothetical protein|nr:hypothetical protein [Solirubrobacterales bacterium]
MNITTKLAALFATSALLLTPAVALAEGPVYAPAPAPKHPAKPKPPGPNASLPEKTKAYGRYCKGFSKKRAKGQSMTPFSRCLNAMAAAAGAKKTATIACKSFSKEHVKGQAGTEFSRCVTAAAKAKKAAAS